MFNFDFLLSLPGGAEWIIIILFLAIVFVCPVLAIVFYLQSKRLRKENIELVARLEKHK